MILKTVKSYKLNWLMAAFGQLDMVRIVVGLDGHNMQKLLRSALPQSTFQHRRRVSGRARLERRRPPERFGS